MLMPLAAAAALAAGPARAESLSDVLAEVYRTNPTIEAARARLRETNERVPQALSGWRPTVTVNASAGQRTVDTADPLTRSGDSTPVSGSLQVRQPLYRGGRTFAEVDRAERQVAAQRAVLAATRQRVFARAVRAYADVRRDRRILELTERNVEILRELVSATRDQLDEGFTTRANRAEAESRLSGARARREEARGALEASRARFEEVVGRPPAELEPIAAPPGVPEGLEAAVALARAENPRVAAARLRAEAARAGVRVAVGQLLPSLSLQGTLRRQDDVARSGVKQDSAAVSLNLEVPLFQAGAAHSRVRQAKQAASRRRVETAEADRSARQAAKSAWARYTSTLQRLDALESQAEQAEAALEGARAEFRAGTRTIRSVLDAETDRISARVQLARANRTRDVAAFELLRAAGRLTVANLDLPVARPTPEKAYDAVRDRWIGLDAPGDDADGPVD